MKTHNFSVNVFSLFLIGLLEIPSPIHAELGDIVHLTNLNASSERPIEQPKNPLPLDQRVGFAVVGLGHLALAEIIPAFAECRYAKLTALVSGDPEKMAKIGAQYGISSEHQYSYKTFEKLKDDKSVQVIYIVLPNSQHKEFTVRSAAIGKNVLCEKPMATSVKEARAMIEACKKANIKLMIAYRLQYEPYNKAMIELTRTKELGDLKTITAENTHNVGDPTQFRLHSDLAGGGPLMDMGIYCINAARYVTGEEPTVVYGDVSRNTTDPRFKEVEEQVNFIMRFPSRITMNGYTGYNAHSVQRYRLLFTEGWAELDPAFPYKGLRMRVAHLGRDKKTEIIEERRLPVGDQFADEMDDLAHRLLKNQPVRTPGEEGLQDQMIMEAIYRSGTAHKPITLPLVNGKDATRGPSLSEDKN